MVCKAKSSPPDPNSHSIEDPNSGPLAGDHLICRQTADRDGVKEGTQAKWGREIEEGIGG